MVFFLRLALITLHFSLKQQVLLLKLVDASGIDVLLIFGHVVLHLFHPLREPQSADCFIQIGPFERNGGDHHCLTVAA